MSIKSKLLAGAATLTLVGGVGLAGALTAGPAAAGTPSCGPGCINIFNQDFGPSFVVDVLKQGEKVNQPIILFRNANFDPAEDWSISFQGTVADFFVAGLVDAATALHYGCDAATTGFAGGTCLTLPEPRRVRDRVRAVRRGQRPVHGRRCHRVPGRGRYAAAVRRVGQDRVDRGRPRCRRPQLDR